MTFQLVPISYKGMVLDDEAAKRWTEIMNDQMECDPDNWGESSKVLFEEWIKGTYELFTHLTVERQLAFNHRAFEDYKEGRTFPINLKARQHGQTRTHFKMVTGEDLFPEERGVDSN